MEKYIISKFKNEFIFVNVEIDPRLWYNQTMINVLTMFLTHYFQGKKMYWSTPNPNLKGS